MIPPLPSGLRERYAVQGVLGRGGFGVVLDATDRELGRPVALKLLSLGAGDPSVRERFVREARVTAGLEHPHVVRVYDFGLEEESAWIAYERIDGGSLGERSGDGRLAREDLVRWGHQAATALEAAHRLGVVHRDVKPENLLLRETGELVLADFGIARSSRAGTMRTPEGMILGTPPFMAPEVILGEVPTPAADQFALAASLYLLATGETVYETVDLAGILERVRGGFDPPAHPWLPGIERALALDPEDRFRDLSGFAGALSGEAPVERPTVSRKPRREDAPLTVRVATGGEGGTRKEAEPRGRAAARPWRLAAVGLGVALVLGYGLSPGRREPPEREEASPAPGIRRAEAGIDTLRRAIEALKEPHRDEDGELGAPWGEHVDRVLPALLERVLVRRTQGLFDALEGWMREVERPEDTDEFWEANRVLAHVFEDLQVAERTASKERLRLDRTDEERAAAGERLETIETHVEQLRPQAEDFLERLEREGDETPSVALTILEGTLAAGLGLDRGRDVMQRVGALLRRRGVGPEEIGLIHVHLGCLRSPELEGKVPAEERLVELREVGQLAAAGTVPQGYRLDHARAYYFTLHFELCWDRPELVESEDGRVADRLLDMMEGLLAAGRAEAFRSALEKPWKTSIGRRGSAAGGLGQRPGWPKRLRRIRALFAWSDPELVEAREELVAAFGDLAAGLDLQPPEGAYVLTPAQKRANLSVLLEGDWEPAFPRLEAAARAWLDAFVSAEPPPERPEVRVERILLDGVPGVMDSLRETGDPNFLRLLEDAGRSGAAAARLDGLRSWTKSFLDEVIAWIPGPPHWVVVLEAEWRVKRLRKPARGLLERVATAWSKPFGEGDLRLAHALTEALTDRLRRFDPPLEVAPEGRCQDTPGLVRELLDGFGSRQRAPPSEILSMLLLAGARFAYQCDAAPPWIDRVLDFAGPGALDEAASDESLRLLSEALGSLEDGAARETLERLRHR